jgi:hypothetical protein
MKVVITESRLEKVFSTYMKSMYDLSYNIASREFIGMDKKVFGYLLNSHFYYGDYSTEYTLNEMFGKTTNKLLLNYLGNEFPGISINGIE